MQYIDTHCHLDGEEFQDDLEAVIARAREAGVQAIGVPGINLQSLDTVISVCKRYPGYCYPMLGLHPEDVKSDWREVLDRIKPFLIHPTPGPSPDMGGEYPIAIGEVGLDFYWSREFENEQLEAFEEQVCWSVELQLPLMIHCRKAQNEMVAIIKKYQKELPGGVFHCFTGNEHEAEELLQFDRFVLGIGGVSTFKKSHLPEVLPAVVPLDRIVLETDAPYMAPVPKRGERNEPAFVAYVLKKLSEAYGVSEEEVAQKTNANCKKVLNISI
jgi:TatD DNase family protein